MGDTTMEALSDKALAMLREAALAAEDTLTMQRVDHERRRRTTVEVREAERSHAESSARTLGHVLADARNKAEALEHAPSLTDHERRAARAVRNRAAMGLELVDALLLSLRVHS